MIIEIEGNRKTIRGAVNEPAIHWYLSVTDLERGWQAVPYGWRSEIFEDWAAVETALEELAPHIVRGLEQKAEAGLGFGQHPNIIPIDYPHLMPPEET